MIHEYKKEWIQNASEPYVIHGVNTLGVMGAGAAKALKQKFPENFQIYKSVCNALGKDALGRASHCVENGVMVINLFIQDRIDGPQPRLDYDALESALQWPIVRWLEDQVSDHGTQKIAMTKIGCGLAGGDWNIVSRMIDYYLPNSRVIVYEGRDDVLSN